ncbi:signal peptidase II [Frateuria defendens]|uniref:signal peptidase II n=1 Tax=Frateuria defendens TaxID=2219559 RepID=UPI00066FBB7C|nr:signal peptidase II [Frateuria defendens]
MTTTPKPNALAWLLLSAVVIVFDQLSKLWALSALQPGVPHPVVPGLLNWTLAFNTGAAFSFLAGAVEGWQRWFFVALAVAISAVLAGWLWRTPRRDWRTAAPVALVIGGALGNLIDRLHAAQVTDFIHVHYYDAWNYPVFNLADCAITVGAVLLVAFGLLAGRPAGGVR